MNFEKYIYICIFIIVMEFDPAAPFRQLKEEKE